jgi:DNA-binding NarL/FixJ family response regulator
MIFARCVSREMQIIRLLAAGKANKEIAMELTRALAALFRVIAQVFLG